MAVYAVGDLQGCRAEFDELLNVLDFGTKDELWLVGDLINRGADSLGTLRRVYAMRDQCRVVLGNHDLHLLAMVFGGHSPRSTDTFDEILSAPDLPELAQWLVAQPLLHHDTKLGYVMVHAGVPHIWSLPQAVTLAEEVQSVLRGEQGKSARRAFFEQMYGNEPACWDDELAGMPRLRLITNYFTRLRLLDDAGCMDFAHKGLLADAPEGLQAWYQLFDRAEFGADIVFGHWAALDGEASNKHVHALDTGCVWGRSLTAMCLRTNKRYSVRCPFPRT